MNQLTREYIASLEHQVRMLRGVALWASIALVITMASLLVVIYLKVIA